MLATRVVPVLLKRGQQLVKGERFQSWRSVGHVLQAAKIHQARSVDELIVLDIAATPEGRGPDFEAIKELTRECFMPITVGGGVRGIEDVQGLLNAGADKVAIGTMALERPDLIREISNRYGRQVVTAVIDARYLYEDCWVVSSHCGSRKLKIRTDSLVRIFERYGAGEIFLQSTERDGMMCGYDLDLIRSVSEAVSIPVIACGGCSGYEDMANAIKVGASAVAAGALFQFTDCTPRGASEYLAKHGIETRIPA